MPPSSWAIRVAHVAVRPSRIVARVRVGEERFAVSTPRLIEALLPRFPHLLEHACVNGAGDRFGCVAAATSTPHVLEHLVIEEQVRLEAASGASSAAVYVGKTSWEDRRRLVARVEVSYADDLAALRALSTAAARLNEALLTTATVAGTEPGALRR